MSPLDSDDGIHVCVDAPFKRNDNLNLTRPGVLRQYFGNDTVRDNHYKDYVYRYSYGVGSGSATSSVGSDPDLITTRPMSPELNELGSLIHETIFGDNSQRQRLMTMRKHSCKINEAPFNHCSVLLYYSINGVKKASTLSKHTDCVYNKKGIFMDNLNSQVENTVTASCTLGDGRFINFFRRNVLQVEHNQFKEHWTMDQLYKEKLELNNGDIMIIHPDDERPVEVNRNNDLLLEQILHGDVNVDNDTFSIGILFRTVKNVQAYKRSTNQLLSVNTISKVQSTHGDVSVGDESITRKRLDEIHEKIQKKFIETMNQK